MANSPGQLPAQEGINGEGTPKPTSLLGLPAELRDNIHDHLFAQIRSHPTSEYLTNLNNFSPCYPDRVYYEAPVIVGFMRTSKMLRREAAPRYVEYLTALRRSLQGHIEELKKKRIRDESDMWIFRFPKPQPATPTAFEQAVSKIQDDEIEAAEKKIERIDELLRVL